MNVLVIDDQPLPRDLFAEFLELLGHESDLALHRLGDVATHPDCLDAERGEAPYRERWRSPSREACVRSWLAATRTSAASPGAGDEAQPHLVLATAMFREMGMRLGPATADTD